MKRNDYRLNSSLVVIFGYIPSLQVYLTLFYLFYVSIGFDIIID